MRLPDTIEWRGLLLHRRQHSVPARWVAEDEDLLVIVKRERGRWRGEIWIAGAAWGPGYLALPGASPQDALNGEARNYAGCAFARLEIVRPELEEYFRA